MTLNIISFQLSYIVPLNRPQILLCSSSPSVSIDYNNLNISKIKCSALCFSLKWDKRKWPGELKIRTEFSSHKSLGLLMETKHMHLTLHFHIFSILGWFNRKMLPWILTGYQFIIQNKLQHSFFWKLRIILSYSTDKETRSGFARFWECI